MTVTLNFLIMETWKWVVDKKKKLLQQVHVGKLLIHCTTYLILAFPKFHFLIFLSGALIY